MPSQAPALPMSLSPHVTVMADSSPGFGAGAEAPLLPSLTLRPPPPDTAAALRLMEESLLLDQNFRHKAEKLLGIFQSELFQALLGAYGWSLGVWDLDQRGGA